MKRYIILDLDGTIVDSEWTLEREVIREIELYKPQYVDIAKYFWDKLNGMWFRDFLKEIFEEEKDVDYMEEKLKIIIENHRDSFRFFPWAIETIKTLSLNYTLFLSTGNYTSNAEQILKRWWILELFAHVQWSDIIPKSQKHIDIFKEVTLDPDFEKFAISIWDWEIEKQVAIESGIDFIQVWANSTHPHTIETFKEIIDFLQKFSNTESLEIWEQNYIL